MQKNGQPKLTNMKTLILGMTDEQVRELCSLLGVIARDTYDAELVHEVRKYQNSHRLKEDGIVGFKTWKSLLLGNQTRTKADTDAIQVAAKLLDCEAEALDAVIQVETGGRGGFLSNGKPPILFEGHIFWKELQSRGIDPNRFASSYPDVLYPKWTTKHYKGGLAEWVRLERARHIDTDAANASASWGIFQIMGNNYKQCGCSSIGEFVGMNLTNEFNQMMLGVMFIKNSPNILKALQERDWSNFARYYNGSGQVGFYSEKLKEAYNRKKSD